MLSVTQFVVSASVDRSPWGSPEAWPRVLAIVWRDNVAVEVAAVMAHCS